MSFSFLKTVNPAPAVKTLLHQSIAGMEEARPHFPLRASMLMPKKGEFCPREHALLDIVQGKQKPEFIGTSMRLTFDHGKDTENRVRNKYLRHIAVGQWRCGVCGFLREEITKAPLIKCPKCHWNRWLYEEVRFASQKTGISGGIDLLLEVGRPKLRLIELKTMSGDEFKELKAPLAEHRFRTSLYLDLAKDDTLPFSNRVDTSEASILYISKGFGVADKTLGAQGIKDSPFTPFKEFVVKADPAISQVQKDKARTLKAWRDDKSLGLPAGVCINGLTKRAQGCNVCGACWSGKFPATLTWIENGKPRHDGKKLVD